MSAPVMDAARQMLDKAARHLQAGQVEEAKSACKLVLDTDPEQPVLLCQLGQTLSALGCPGEAEQAFQRVVDLFPAQTASYQNLAAFYTWQNSMAKAEEAYRRSLTFDPDNTDVKRDLGFVLHKLGRIDEAIDVLEQAARAVPADLKAWAKLGNLLPKTARFREHLKFVKNFLRLSQPLDDAISKIVLGLFLNPEIGVADEGNLIRKMFRYMKQYEAGPVRNSTPAQGERITIGYLSGFMRYQNYMGYLEHIVGNHDRDKFVVKIYSDSHKTDPGEEIRGTHNLDNVRLYEKIQADGVDILIDLNGFSSINRMALLAMKPSPVIVSWYNAFSTLGLDTVDYLIGDDCVTPADEDRHYSENIFRLPGCYLLRSVEADVPPVSEAPIAKNGFCTFGSLSTDYKINIATIELWAAILNRVPGSRFILRNSDMTDGIRGFYRDEFAKYRIDETRIDFLGAAPHAEFLETYDRIDIVLDTYPLNGGTSCAEALWQGVPVVTFRGKRWASRVAATIVSAIGHPEWVGQDTNEYAGIAVSLARNPHELEARRGAQRQKMADSILYDATGFTRKLETAYEHMIRETGAVP